MSEHAHRPQRAVVRDPARARHPGGGVLRAVGADEARRAAERLCQALAEQPLGLHLGQSLTVTGSFGVASACELAPGEESGEALIALADRRLYQAKAAGRNCVF